MKYFTSIFFAISILLLLSSVGQAQSLTGPTILCSGSGGTYYFDDDIPGLTAYWYQDGNYLGTGMSKSMDWYSSGSISVDVNNSSGYLYSVGLGVVVKTPGTISAPLQVCSGQLFNLSRLGSAGNSFTWRARPASGGSWTTLGTGTTISNYSITQNTYFEVVLNDCASNNIAGHTVNLYPTQTGGTIQSPVSVICYGTSVGDIYLTVNPVGETSSYQWQQSPNGSTWTNISGATSFNYNPGPIASSTYFRRNATGCSVTASSNAVYIQVDAPSNAGTLSFQSSHTTCVNGTANLQVSGMVGSITNWNYRYKEGSAGSWSAWTSFSTANQSTNALAITSGSSIERYYEFSVTAKNGVCNSITGNVITTTMYPTTVAGNTTVTGPLEAFGSTSGNIVVASAVGNITQYHESFDGVTWVNRGTSAYNIRESLITSF